MFYYILIWLKFNLFFTTEGCVWLKNVHFDFIISGSYGYYTPEECEQICLDIDFQYTPLGVYYKPDSCECNIGKNIYNGGASPKSNIIDKIVKKDVPGKSRILCGVRADRNVTYPGDEITILVVDAMALSNVKESELYFFADDNSDEPSERVYIKNPEEIAEKSKFSETLKGLHSRQYNRVTQLPNAKIAHGNYFFVRAKVGDLHNRMLTIVLKETFLNDTVKVRSTSVQVLQRNRNCRLMTTYAITQANGLATVSVRASTGPYCNSDLLNVTVNLMATPNLEFKKAEDVHDDSIQPQVMSFGGKIPLVKYNIFYIDSTVDWEFVYKVTPNKRKYAEILVDVAYTKKPWKPLHHHKMVFQSKVLRIETKPTSLAGSNTMAWRSPVAKFDMKIGPREIVKSAADYKYHDKKKDIDFCFYDQISAKHTCARYYNHDNFEGRMLIVKSGVHNSQIIGRGHHAEVYYTDSRQRARRDGFFTNDPQKNVFRQPQKLYQNSTLDEILEFEYFEVSNYGIESTTRPTGMKIIF